MKVFGLKSIIKVLSVAALCNGIIGCRPPDLDDQLRSWDKKVEEQLGASSPKWIAAYGVVQEASPVCQSEWDKERVADWRAQWEKKLKSRYLAAIFPDIVKVQNAWIVDGKLNLPNGDGARKELLKRMMADLPTPMKDCAVLVDMQLGSDRNIARMKITFQGLLKRVQDCDPNGGSPVVKTLDAIQSGFKETCKWHSKIDEFMTKLSDPEVVAWYPMRPATYKRDSIAPMEKIRDELSRQYKVKRWTVRVNDRKNDYARVLQLSAAGQYKDAMRILAEHDLIVKPEGLDGIVDFDDSLERSRVANSGLARQIVKNLMGNGLSGVQYWRRTRRGIYSILVIGRAPIDGDERNKRKAIRMAFKMAQLNAGTEYSKFLGTYIDSLTENDIELKSGETMEHFKDHLRQSSKATLNNMSVVARTIDRDEAVIVLGWRDPEVGNILMGEPLEPIDGGRVEVAPSVGAYL